MKRVVIKTGGKAAEDSRALTALAQEMKMLSDHYDFILVHGGGAAVSSIQKQYGIEPLFIDGKRITGPREMDLVDMGLSGLMNTYLVRLLKQQGLKAVGLTGADGSLFTGESLGDYQGKENRTGKVISTDVSLLTHLEKAGYLPVVCSVSVDDQGRGININADEAALAISVGLEADDLIFISDIPGIMKEGVVQKELHENEALQLIDSAVIQGGMIPKVHSSLEALKQGVGTIIIGEYKQSGDLKNLLNKQQGSGLIL